MFLTKILLCLAGKLHPPIVKSCLGVLIQRILALGIFTLAAGIGVRARHDFAKKHFLDKRGASADNECALMWSDSDTGMNQEAFSNPVINMFCPKESVWNVGDLLSPQILSTLFFYCILCEINELSLTVCPGIRSVIFCVSSSYCILSV